jgi:hypothetical protein
LGELQQLVELVAQSLEGYLSLVKICSLEMLPWSLVGMLVALAPLKLALKKWFLSLGALHHLHQDLHRIRHHQHHRKE